MFTQLVSKYLEAYAEKIPSDYHCGFHRCQSTNNQIFSLKMTIREVL